MISRAEIRHMSPARPVVGPAAGERVAWRFRWLNADHGATRRAPPATGPRTGLAGLSWVFVAFPFGLVVGLSVRPRYERQSKFRNFFARPSAAPMRSLAS